MSVESLFKHCCIRSDVIHSIPSCKQGEFSWPFFLQCLSFPGGFIGRRAGSVWPQRAPSHRQPVLSAGICLPSCWTHECHRALGLVMQIMTLDLPRRGRLGGDQLRVKPCLEPDRLTRWKAGCCAVWQPWRRKGCWKWEPSCWGEPLCQLGQGHARGNAKENARGSFPVFQGWASLPGCCRHGNSGSSGARQLPLDLCRVLCLCHCHDLQTLPFYWAILGGVFHARCPPQTIKPASYTKNNSLYFIITSFSFGFCIADSKHCLPSKGSMHRTSSLNIQKSKTCNSFWSSLYWPKVSTFGGKIILS